MSFDDARQASDYMPEGKMRHTHLQNIAIQEDSLTRVLLPDFHDQPSRERARDGDSNPRPRTSAAASSARPLTILLIKYLHLLIKHIRPLSSLLLRTAADNNEG